MKRLILLRHAKSSWDDLSLRDIDRPLNARGLRDAPGVGTYLQRAGFSPDIVFLSPAQRTRSTAEQVFPDAPKTIVDNFYGADVGTIVHFIRHCDDAYETIALVGHNPTFTLLHHRLLGTHLTNLPTCGAIIIDFQADSWSSFDDSPTALVDLVMPKKI